MYKTLSRNRQRGKGVDRTDSFKGEASRIIHREKEISKVFWEVKDAVDNGRRLPCLPGWIKKEVNSCSTPIRWVEKNLKCQTSIKKRQEELARPGRKVDGPKKISGSLKNNVKKNMQRPKNEVTACCMICGAEIKVKNLKRHQRKVHSVDVSQGRNSPPSQRHTAPNIIEITHKAFYESAPEHRKKLLAQMSSADRKKFLNRAC